MPRFRLTPLLAIAVLAGACASGGQGGAPSRRDRNLITAAEIAEDPIITNAFEAVRRLRPDWLRARGRSGPPVVYHGEAKWSDSANGLTGIAIAGLLEIRYYSRSDATTRWGRGILGGVIQVITR